MAQHGALGAVGNRKANEDIVFRIFISYRRGDTVGVADRIWDRLTERFGSETVFRDIDSTRGGSDFRAQINDALSNCDLLIALIGERWFGQEDGNDRRIDDPSDYVRLEVASALARDIPVLPILIGDTPMPAAKQLPLELRELSYRKARRIDHGLVSRHQITKIIRDIEELLKGQNSKRNENTLLRIVSFRKTAEDPFPIWVFTLVNRSSSSQIVNALECEVLEYRGYTSIPETRVLRSLAVWDIGLPGQSDVARYSPEPVLIGTDDAASISLRFHCGHPKSRISPNNVGSYKVVVRFFTDQGLIAASDIFSV